MVGFYFRCFILTRNLGEADENGDIGIFFFFENIGKKLLKWGNESITKYQKNYLLLCCNNCPQSSISQTRIFSKKKSYIFRNLFTSIEKARDNQTRGRKRAVIFPRPRSKNTREKPNRLSKIASQVQARMKLWIFLMETRLAFSLSFTLMGTSAEKKATKRRWKKALLLTEIHLEVSNSQSRCLEANIFSTPLF